MAGWQRAGLRLVILLLAAALLLAVASMLKDSRLWTRIVDRFGPAEQGTWLVLSIDGSPVPRGEYVVGIADRRVTGGRDGCNSWGYRDERDPNGARRIFSTLVACPDDDPVRRAYWALASAERPGLSFTPGGLLWLRARGHVAALRRCHYRRVVRRTDWSYSETMECVPD